MKVSSAALSHRITVPGWFIICAFCLLTALSLSAATDEEVITRRLEIADSLHSVGRTDSAAVMGEETIRMAERLGNPTMKVGANSAQGVYLRSLGRVDEALEKYNAGLAIATSEDFRSNPDLDAIEEIASLYINLAVLNLDMQNKEQAVQNSVFAADWISRSNDPGLKSAIYGVAGSVLTAAGEYKKALGYQDLAYKNAEAAGNKDGAFRAAAYTMLLADRTGEKATAGEWRDKCAALLPQIESLMTRLVYYQAECSIALKDENYKNVIGWFEKILSQDGIDNLPFIKIDCYNNMHIAYAALGEYDKAYSSLLKSNELKDSIMEEQKNESLRELTVKYDTKEKELALAQSEAKRSRTLMWLFAAVALLIAAIGIFLYYSARQRRRRMQKEMEFTALKAETERLMTAQYLEGLEAERVRMSRELHDGVCNDLLAIQMNIRNGEATDATEALIDGCRESVRRISHELMPPEFAYATIDEVAKYYVIKQAQANSGKIEITYSSEAEGADWSLIPDSAALDIYRIIQEAVGNAVKHSGAERIDVRMQLQPHQLSLTVSDNGTFIRSDKKGLGLESMRRRAAAIGGEINIENTKDGGTVISLTVKI